MPTTASRSRSTSRAASSARQQVLTQLKEDHKSVKKAYREFQKLEAQQDEQACEAIVRQVLDELSLHAAVEEELLYPAARGAMADEHLIDEAEVEHESMHTLIGQLRSLAADDDKFAARFTVLCEYVLHHVKEEEREIFPQLESARLDWESLAAEIDQRRQELAPVQAEGPGKPAARSRMPSDDDDFDPDEEGGSGARAAPLEQALAPRRP